jgi:FHS family L-fucose permease-like MFS transporter
LPVFSNLPINDQTMALASTSVKISAESGKTNYLFPLILVTSLFFLWGLAYGLLDVLNKHFQELLSITKTRSTFITRGIFWALIF